MVHAPTGRTGLALAQQHIDQVLRRAVAKQLALVLLMEGHAVLLQQRDEIGRCVARQGAAAERRVLAQEMPVRLAHVQVAVGEVAATAAGDANFFSHFFAVVKDEDLQALLRGNTRAKQTGSTGAHNHNVKRFHAVSLVGVALTLPCMGTSFGSYAAARLEIASPRTHARQRQSNRFRGHEVCAYAFRCWRVTANRN